MIIRIGQTFCAVPYPHHPRSCQGQGHRLRIFMLNFMSKFLGPHYFFILIDKHEFRREILSWQKVLFFLFFFLFVFLKLVSGTQYWSVRPVFHDPLILMYILKTI